MFFYNFFKKHLTFSKRPHNQRGYSFSFAILGGVFLLPSNRSHAAYCEFVTSQIRLHYVGGILTLIPADWILLEKLWITDLSGTADFLKDQYGRRGPKPTDPDCLLRSYLLMILTKQPSITRWVDDLRRTPLFAIMSGFEPGKTPGIGTFYDFFPRLWNAHAKNSKPHEKRRKQKPKKGTKKGEKAPTTSPGKVARLVARLLGGDHTKRSSQPFDRLFDFFQSNFLSVSADLGLLGSLDSLAIAGDGTPVVTSSLLRSKSICNCRAQGLENCRHKRFFSQPDCDSGWDSSRERFFNGYHLYMFTASDSPHDLPVYPRLQPASRHDSLSLIVSSIEFSQRFSLGTVYRVILDSAHDAMGIYQLLTHHHVEPIIDLNSHTAKNVPLAGDFTMTPDGVPVCSANVKMKSNGFDRQKNCHKWRCGLSSGTVNTCSAPCSTAKYGRTFLTYLGDNPRLITKTKRGTKEWTLIYNRRTAAERSNKREKVDYKLESARHRSTMMWYMRTFAIMMCQHIDAWRIYRKDSLALKSIIFG